MNDDETIVQRFSNYICLVDRENSRHTVPVNVCDPISKSLIEALLQDQDNCGTADAWARSFLQNCLSFLENFSLVWKANNSKITIFNQCIYLYFCNRFLFLYLQLVCWEAALHLNNKMGQFSHKATGLSIEDYFLIACEASLDFSNLLRSFNFNSLTSLHSFSRLVIQRKVTNQVVSRLKNKTLKFTRYGLLKNTGPNILEKALLDYGILPKAVFGHKLAHQSFKDYFSQSAATGPKAEKSHAGKVYIGPQAIKAMTKRFNSQVERLQGRVSHINEEKLLKYLETCIKAVQDSQNPKTVSLDKLMQDSNDIPVSSESYLISEDEWQLDDGYNEANGAKDIVLTAFNTLPPLAQSSLVLWLGLDIKQSDFLTVLAVQKQFQVARKFQRYQKDMLKVIVHNASDEISKQKISNFNELCKEKLALIKDYLKVYSHQKLAKQAEYSLIHDLAPPDRKKLKQWLLTLDIDAVRIRHEKTLASEPIAELIKFEERFKTTIEERMPYRLDQLDSANVRVRAFLISWLADNQAIV